MTQVRNGARGIGRGAARAEILAQADTLAAAPGAGSAAASAAGPEADTLAPPAAGKSSADCA